MGLQIGDKVGAAPVKRTFEGMPGIWRAVQTRPALEGKVAEGLGHYGLDAYLPMETFWRKVRGKNIPQSRPLIRGYVFALMPPEAEPLVHDIDGATRLLGLHGVPATIPSAFVEALRRQEAKGKYDHTRLERARRVGAKRTLGEAVRMTEGPWAGLAATVIQLRGNRRVELLVSLFGRSTPVIAELAQLESRALDDGVDEPRKSAA